MATLTSEGQPQGSVEGNKLKHTVVSYRCDDEDNHRNARQKISTSILAERFFYLRILACVKFCLNRKVKIFLTNRIKQECQDNGVFSTQKTWQIKMLRKIWGLFTCTPTENKFIKKWNVYKPGEKTHRKPGFFFNFFSSENCFYKLKKNSLRDPLSF